ncbi:MAG: YtxH domain-containing protein [Alistipes sp.]|jgi:gas vesicle protein|nr:YtxH domain-containing protein [Alistipes sp.]
MKNTTLSVLALLGGMVLGSAVALAFAPKTGEEMRGMVRDFLGDEMNKWHEACRQAKAACESESKG